MDTEKHGNVGAPAKPLEGFPMVSDNCWKAILEAFRGRLRDQDQTRVLEWGAGNSTISFVREGIASGKKLSVTSIEHETGFFPWLAEAIMAEFSGKFPADRTKISWRPLQGPVIPLSRIGSVLSGRKALTCPSLKWQILSNNKRLQYTEGVRPDFGFSILKTLRQSMKLALVELGYWAWFAAGIARSFRPGSSEMYGLGNSVFEAGALPEKGVFSERFAEHPFAGCLKISAGDVVVELWHIPVLKTVFWGKDILSDGAVTQLPDFIGVPLEGKFDVVFIDGRARVSCIKRVHRDRLLKDGGWLFVHDAFRFEMMEGFLAFDQTPSFLHGSNVTMGGDIRCKDGYGPPLIRAGASPETAGPQIDQELFMYRNTR